MWSPGRTPGVDGLLPPMVATASPLRPKTNSWAASTGQQSLMNGIDSWAAASFSSRLDSSWHLSSRPLQLESKRELKDAAAHESMPFIKDCWPVHAAQEFVFG